jgi:hypothetical protein
MCVPGSSSQHSSLMEATSPLAWTHLHLAWFVSESTCVVYHHDTVIGSAGFCGVQEQQAVGYMDPSKRLVGQYSNSCQLCRPPGISLCEHRNIHGLAFAFHLIDCTQQPLKSTCLVTYM